MNTSEGALGVKRSGAHEGDLWTGRHRERHFNAGEYEMEATLQDKADKALSTGLRGPSLSKLRE